MSKLIDALLCDAVSEGVFPGASYCYGSMAPHTTAWGAVGRNEYEEKSRPITLDTVWDLASVSKVVATTTCVMMLYDSGEISLDDTVASVLPEFAQGGKQHVTMRNLLVHDSGLIAFRRYQETCTTPDQVWSAIAAEELTYPTGTKMVYSDLSMIAMQKVIEKLSGKSLDSLAEERIWKPLQMSDTCYSPGIGNPRCAPTETIESWRRELWKLRGQETPDSSFIQGEVHDPTAAVMGGVAGHAGLFSTVKDLQRFVHFLMAGGLGLVNPETIGLFTAKHGELSTRGLGWDTKSPTGSSAGELFGPRSYGHTGYTGTSVWIDPDAQIFAILLTNRVNPTSENVKIQDLRPKFHDEVARELTGEGVSG